jgi:hypothetical protein
MSVWDSTSIKHWRRPARTLLRGRTESPIRSRRAILPAAPGAFALPVQRRLRCAAARLSRVVEVTPASGSLEQLAREHAVLRRLATLVASEPPPDEVFTAVAREAGLLLGAQRGTRGGPTAYWRGGPAGRFRRTGGLCGSERSDPKRARSLAHPTRRSLGRGATFGSNATFTTAPSNGSWSPRSS